MMRFLVASWLALGLLGGMVGCSSAPVATPAQSVALFHKKTYTYTPKTVDQVELKEGLTGRHLSPGEVADLSERLLADGDNVLNNQKTMARLELLILKAMKSPEKTYRPILWRDLGIIHYHQRKYKQARQELQAANELNPRSARTHFYLACLFAQQGLIYERQGKRRVSQQQFKRAAIEMEQAHKLAPSNALYKEDPRQVIRQENGP
jgi:tetratricopeptide (TPR) repeat protein